MQQPPLRPSPRGISLAMPRSRLFGSVNALLRIVLAARLHLLPHYAKVQCSRSRSSTCLALTDSGSFHQSTTYFSPFPHGTLHYR